MSNEQLFSHMYITVRESYIQWEDDDVHCTRLTHFMLEFYSDSSLKEQSAGR